ncbi:MAG: DUF3127 domain-containing protein [Planctomycetota bacterium]
MHPNIERYLEEYRKEQERNKTMPSYIVKGTVKLVGDVQSFSSGFTKRVLVVTTEDDRYPQDVPIEFVKDQCSMLDAVEVGDTVEAHFDLRGNEYKDKYYASLNGWKIDLANGAATAQEAPSNDDEGDAPF